MKKFTLLIAILLVQFYCLAQAPNINFPSGTYNFSTGIAITPFTLINTGGAVPSAFYGQVTTFAGSGTPGSLNGTSNVSSFNNPWGLTIDAAGNLYVADSSNQLIRKITTDGTASTLAGGVGNQGAIDGIGVAASFFYPKGVAVDASGSVYVADTYNNKIRKINSAGLVTTFAGSGVAGSTNGTGTLASFYYPSGLAVDPYGNIYVADQALDLIRKITPAGVVTTFAGSVTGSTDGTGTLASFANPYSLASDTSGNIYVADEYNNKIRKITPAGVVTTLAGNGAAGSVDGIGTAASFYHPYGVATDTQGNVYVSDTNNSRIRKISPTGVVSTLAGSGAYSSIDAIGSAASFMSPYGLVTNTTGDYLYIADLSSHKIRKIALVGYSISPSLPAGLSFDTATGTISGTPTTDTPATTYTIIAYNTIGNSTTTVSISSSVLQTPSISYSTPQTFSVGTAITSLTPTNTGGEVPNSIYGQASRFAGSNSAYPGAVDGTGLAASFNYPNGVATDTQGNVYVADTENHKIRKITNTGVVTTFAGSGLIGAVDGLGSMASFNTPYGLTLDATGCVFVADTGNHKIRKITPAGLVSTFAGNGTVGSNDGLGISAKFFAPHGIALDIAGNIYVADSNNDKIRKITPAGIVTTLAGNGFSGSTDGMGSASTFYYPTGLVIDASNNVYVVDHNNHKIRKITPAGVVSTFAGNTFGSNDGIGTLASFQYPTDITLDAAGNFYVTDSSNQKIRKITEVGVVSTLADGKTGSFDFIGSQNPFWLTGITSDKIGNLFVADPGNLKIRKISIFGYNISPNLPTGLNLDATGTISGIPTASSPSTTYTVTAYNNAGSSSATVDITVNCVTLVTPTFTTISPICTGATLSALPTTSINGITGTWSPVLNNTATTIYTFTPTAGLCSTSTTLTITVNVTPAATASAQTFCNTATVGDLVATGTAPKWYASATLGSALANATAVLTATYYVTQTLNGCESATRTAVAIKVTPKPVQPALACYESATFNTTTCAWVVTGTKPAQPALACYESATFNTTNCAWVVTGAKPVQPALACYESATFNTTTCAWVVSGTKPVQPALACYESATFNTTTCAWVVSGTKPAQPALACYESATFNTGTCAWVVSGTKPVQPALACYESATFNTNTCAWVVSGTKPVQPALACYESATFNTTSCAWVVSGIKPVQPALACYESATFNTTNCAWVVTGAKPVQPALACYESATFNTTTCAWVVSGTKPVQPALACYESANFNTNTCAWVVSGAKPVQPALACYESATFNTGTCAWVVSGTKPVQPALACYESATFNTNTCAWVVSGTKPVQPALACYESATFNTNTCAWVVSGTKPVQPALACYESATFNTTTCAWVVSGTKPVQPALACYESATFNTNTCAWVVSGTKPVQPALACYESATFNTNTCAWVVSGTGPAAPTGAITQTFIQGQTIADIAITGTGIIWFATPNDALNQINPLLSTTLLVNGITYYATQNVNGCTSIGLLAVTTTVTLGTKTFEEIGFKYYPNPTTSVLNLQFKEGVTIDSIKVIDLTGKLLLQQTKATNQIDVEHFARGTYFIEVFSGSKKWQAKFIKE